MYIRKTQRELAEERLSRSGKNLGSFIAAGIAFIATLALFKFNKLDIPHDWSFVLTVGIPCASIVGLIVFFIAKRRYVLTGGYSDDDEWVCLSCGKVFGTYNNSAHGLLVFGRKKVKPWQIRACNSPELCDIARIHEVRWVDDEV